MMSMDALSSARPGSNVGGSIDGRRTSLAAPCWSAPATLRLVREATLGEAQAEAIGATANSEPKRTRNSRRRIGVCLQFGHQLPARSGVQRSTLSPLLRHRPRALEAARDYPTSRKTVSSTEHRENRGRCDRWERYHSEKRLSQVSTCRA